MNHYKVIQDHLGCSSFTTFKAENDLEAWAKVAEMTTSTDESISLYRRKYVFFGGKRVRKFWLFVPCDESFGSVVIDLLKEDK